MALCTVIFLNFGICKNIVLEGWFPKLTETRTYSVEPIFQLLHIIATNFGSEKFENLEEGESANDLRVCEIICKIKFLKVRFSCFRNCENNIFKDEPPEQFNPKYTNCHVREPPKSTLI